jgi:hypothetical protein
LPADSTAPIVAVISLLAIVSPAAAIALKSFVSASELAIVRSPIITTLQSGTIIVAITLLLHSTVPTCSILEPLSVARVQSVVQSTNHVIHTLRYTLSGTGTGTGAIASNPTNPAVESSLNH